MTKPTPATDRADFSKYSVDLSQQRKLIPELKKFAVDCLVALLSPALIEHASFLTPEGVPQFRVFSYEEARERLNKDTSSGYPYSSKWPKKADLFAAEDAGVYSLFADYQKLIDDPTFVPIYTVGGKKEIRPVEKIDAGALRSFGACPTHLNILGQVVTGRLQDAVNATWSKHWISNGIDPYHGNWQRIIDEFKDFEIGVWGRDRHKWDGGYPPELHDIAYDVIKAFVEPNAHPLLAVMSAHEASAPCVMMDGDVYWRYGGMCSGSPVTIFNNSLGNIGLFFYLVAYNRYRASGLSVRDFLAREHFLDYHTHTHYRAHGDDSMHSCSPGWFRFAAPSALNHALVEHNWPLGYDGDSDITTAPHDTIYLSQVSTFKNHVPVPRLIAPEKILSSLLEGSSLALPPGQTRIFYEMTRLWQYCTVLWPDTELFAALTRAGAALEVLYLSQCDCADDLRRARSAQLSPQELWLLYTQPKSGFARR